MAVRHPSKVIIRVRISLAALFLCHHGLEFVPFEKDLSHLGLKMGRFFEMNLSHFYKKATKRLLSASKQ